MVDRTQSRRPGVPASEWTPRTVSQRSTVERSLPARLVLLYGGLVVYGFGIALQVRADVGLNPWDVLHQGLANRLGWEIGTVAIVVGIPIFLAWFPLRLRPGLGTVSNLLGLGTVANVALGLLPELHGFAVRWAAFAASLLLFATGVSLYLAAQLGPGPRDGVMTGIHKRFGWSIRGVRTVMELLVLAVGWVLGGGLGLGTAVHAVAIGPLVQIGLTTLGVDAAAREAEREAVVPAAPRSSREG